MLFVGGPMHGQQVPNEAQGFIAHGKIMLRVVVLDFDDATGHLVQTSRAYLRIPYWRMGKPLLHFFGLVGMDQDALIEQARELLGS
jgi:hypothetical protein